MEYNFSDIECNTKRAEVIQYFCMLVRTGNRSASEIREIRVLLVKAAIQ